MEDRYDIMKWRNEQMIHLRQANLLTKNVQDNYFKTTVASLFEKECPDQMLFSYLKESKCIGYGGLVHINWEDRNAEISFIMDTQLQPEFFEFHWIQFLKLIEMVAFKELQLRKIYTYAYDIRPEIYPILEGCDFEKEAVLRDHKFLNDRYVDVVIHSKFYK